MPTEVFSLQLPPVLAAAAAAIRKRDLWMLL